MKQRELKLLYTEIAISELDNEDQQLFEEAEKVCSGAYAPYSGFKVGAACLLDNGEIFSASNQENAAYPSGLCAERSLLFYVGGNRPEQKILKLLVVVKAEGKDLSKMYSPCGACRQVMAEYQTRQNHPIKVYFESGNGQLISCDRVDDILPFIFSF